LSFLVFFETPQASQIGQFVFDEFNRRGVRVSLSGNFLGKKIIKFLKVNFEFKIYCCGVVVIRETAAFTLKTSEVYFSKYLSFKCSLKN